jgi:hypothetical protein
MAGDPQQSQPNCCHPRGLAREGGHVHATCIVGGNMIAKHLRRAAAKGSLLTLFALGTGASGAACLTTPVANGEPDTKANFTSTIRQTVVERVDLLFAIDNSASMGDKQELLSEAIPDLLKRLLVPSCVDPKNENRVLSASQNGRCPDGSKIEFAPIKDLHVGIVSSSLGTPGSPTCGDDRNDHGRLLNRSYTGGQPVRSAGSSNFLAWFPPATTDNDTRGEPPANAISDVNTLTSDFQELVRGVREQGCGYEAQLESWYRFLVQPDPYERVAINGGKAKLEGVDEEILRQRHDFLRPDSLVAIIQVTDENESTADPLSMNGTGWKFMDQNFAPPKAKPACADDPSSPDCGPSDQADTTEPEQQSNVRFHQPKRRFGVEPLFPMSRYVNGLGIDASGNPQAAPRVPNRDGEHENGAGRYLGTTNCVNPLFAAKLPTSAGEELCKLLPGPRDPAMVFFAAITGVPSQLLHFDPTDADKSRLTDDDWRLILGRDPLNGDFTGADPHMIESITPRAALKNKNGDAINVREWDTRGNDLQYACTFDLKQKKRCTADSICDCKSGSDSPTCDPQDPTTQVRAKAYPGIRHLALAKALGDQGIVSSICPIDTRDASPTNPNYGYRPAVKVIIDRLKNALASQCLPRRLSALESGKAPCLLLEMLAKPGNQSQCSNPEGGMKQPDPEVLARFLEVQRELHKGDGFDPAKYPVCELTDLSEPDKSCVGDSRAGWCYVSGTASRTATGDRCSNAILFSEGGNPKSGAKVFLQCIETMKGGAASATKTTSSP